MERRSSFLISEPTIRRSGGERSTFRGTTPCSHRRRKGLLLYRRERFRVSLYIAFPFRQQFPQSLSNIRPLCEPVLALPRVSLYVEQKDSRRRAVYDQFPVAAANRLLVHVHRNRSCGAPKQVSLYLRGLPLENGKQVYPFESRIGGHGRSGRCQDRRRQIHRNADLCGNGAGRNAARPAEQRGHPDATFPCRELAMEQRRAVGQSNTAVVIRKDHDRVLL